MNILIQLVITVLLILAGLTIGKGIYNLVFLNPNNQFEIFVNSLENHQPFDLYLPPSYSIEIFKYVDSECRYKVLEAIEEKKLFTEDTWKDGSFYACLIEYPEFINVEVVMFSDEPDDCSFLNYLSEYNKIKCKEIEKPLYIKNEENYFYLTGIYGKIKLYYVLPEDYQDGIFLRWRNVVFGYRCSNCAGIIFKVLPDIIRAKRV